MNSRDFATRRRTVDEATRRRMTSNPYRPSRYYGQRGATTGGRTTIGTAVSSSVSGKGLLIGLLSALGSAILVAVVFSVIYFLKFTNRGRILLDRIGRPGEFDDEQAFLREEEEALERMDEISRVEYLRAKAFVEANPPDSIATDISLSQYLAIQEKGVSAWEFEPELESADCFVQGRTEIEFYDSECSVQSNLPVPKHNEVYYWEAKIYEKPESTVIGIGMTTKPYPTFRLPGFHKHSVAYLSSGHKRHNQPFNPSNYGPHYRQGDVIGVGYRPRTGAIFFTRNGKKLEDISHGFKSLNLFPTVGANGPCKVHVNLGQLGFVFIEANVKKWGLAPVTGSLAPPPPYGSEQGSILLEIGTRESERQGYFDVPAYQAHENASSAAAAGSRPHASSIDSNSTLTPATAGGRRSRAYSTKTLKHQPHHLAPSSTRPPAYPPTSPGPVRSPTDISLAPLNPSSMNAERGPPPEYESPEGSLSSRRGSCESQRRPLLRGARQQQEEEERVDPGEGPAPAGIL